nr:BTAD domain-containing putative transcriptional regulator [Tessaracoccus bendigoensis]
MALLRILGPIEVWSPDAILPDPKSDKIASSERLRRLLCALIVNSDRVVGIDRLAFAVWGDDQPGDPTSALHNLAFRLRSELRRRGVQGIEIHTVAPGYRLVVGAGAIDSQMFTDGVRAACSGMDADPEATLRQLDECEALWRGGAFGDLCDEVWLQPAVARLDELRLRGIEAAADALLLLGRPSEAVERLLPWTMRREPPHAPYAGPGRGEPSDRGACGIPGLERKARGAARHRPDPRGESSASGDTPTARSSGRQDPGKDARTDRQERRTLRGASSHSKASGRDRGRRRRSR